MKWISILWQLMRDVLFTGLGTWIIWKQVYAPVPNPYLLAVAVGLFSPAARSAVISILSGPGLSSESREPPEEPPSKSLPPGGGTGERRG